MTTQTDGPRYPRITVQLSGESGNAFYILGAVRRALKRSLTPAEYARVWPEFYAEATSGDYDNLLATATRWVEVE